MRVTAKGQVTIPQEIREQLGLLPDTEVEFEVDGEAVRIRRAAVQEARGRALLAHLKGRAQGGMSTDEIMALVREMRLHAVVRNGRVTLDEPTDFPEGTVLDLVVDDEGDDLDDQERAELHARLDESWESARRGDVRPASEILNEIRSRR